MVDTEDAYSCFTLYHKYKKERLKEPIVLPPSTNQKLGYEHDAQYLGIPQFISVANADETDIVFCGTDMASPQSTTVKMTLGMF